MSKIRIYDIEWDTEGNAMTDLDLPSEVVIDPEELGIANSDIDRQVEEIGEWLTKTYSGWCVTGFRQEPAPELEAAADEDESPTP